jgi:hypothetical protein
MRFDRKQKCRGLLPGGRTHGLVTVLIFHFRVIASSGLAAGGEDRILSRCGRILSTSVRDFVLVWPGFVPVCPEQWKGRLRSGSKCFSGKLVKLDGDAGVVESVVPQVQCSYHRPRARARLGQTYESGGGDQVQSLQLLSRFSTGVLLMVSGGKPTVDELFRTVRTYTLI